MTGDAATAARRAWLLAGLVALVVIAADQASKALIVHSIQIGEERAEPIGEHGMTTDPFLSVDGAACLHCLKITSDHGVELDPKLS